MQIGIVGLGRMGADMTRRLLRARHQCVVYDIHPAAVKALAGESAFADRLLSAMRYEFGGHIEKNSEGR